MFTLPSGGHSRTGPRRSRDGRTARYLQVFGPVLALSLVLACGPAGRGSPKAPRFPAEALDTLTVEEVERFVQVLPAFVGALEAAGYKSDVPKDLPIARHFAEMPKRVERLRSIPGVVDSLASAGMEWPGFRRTLLKIWAAGYAFGFKARVAGAARIDSLPEGQAKLKELKPLAPACAQVPAENLVLIQHYWRKLALLGKVF